LGEPSANLLNLTQLVTGSQRQQITRAGSGRRREKEEEKEEKKKRQEKKEI